MVRYEVSEDVSYQEATPRGILEGTFTAGPVDVEVGSDEHFIIEYVLIPDGLAALADEQPPEPAPAPVTTDPVEPVEPESAPVAPEPTEPDAPKE